MRYVWGFSSGDALTDDIIRAASVTLGHLTDLPRPTATHIWEEFWWDDETCSAVEAVPWHIRECSPFEKAYVDYPVRRYEISTHPDVVETAYLLARRHVGALYGFDACALAGLLLLLKRRDLFARLPAAHFDCIALAISDARGAGIAAVPALDLPTNGTPALGEQWAIASGCIRLPDDDLTRRLATAQCLSIKEGARAPQRS